MIKQPAIALARRGVVPLHSLCFQFAGACSARFLSTEKSSEAISRSSSSNKSLPSGHKKGVTKKKSSLGPPTGWHRVSGFSRYAARYDMDNCLAGAESVIDGISEVKTMLDRNLFPTGNYAIKIKDTVKANDWFESCKARLKKESSTGKRISLYRMSKKDLKDLTLASDHNIDSKTVRIRNVNRDIGEEEIKYFFKDYELSKDDSVPTFEVLEYNTQYSSNEGKNKQKFGFDWLARFNSSAEAERSLALDNQLLAGKKVNFLWYVNTNVLSFDVV